LYSFTLIPLFEKPLRAMPLTTWKPLGGAALCMSAQAIIFVSTIAYFQNAAAANVLYSVRGLLSIGAVWLLGHWFGNTEKEQGRETFIPRLAGAILMFVAVILVIT
jgi:hypothetical protein